MLLEKAGGNLPTDVPPCLTTDIVTVVVSYYYCIRFASCLIQKVEAPEIEQPLN